MAWRRRSRRRRSAEGAELVLTGLQSDDHGYAQTGVIIAEQLGWPTRRSSWTSRSQDAVAAGEA
jgi:hypothetical protein